MATNVRLSGAQTSGRSESDLRFNYNDLSQDHVQQLASLVDALGEPLAKLTSAVAP